jgi:hypothetical protein
VLNIPNRHFPPNHINFRISALICQQYFFELRKTKKYRGNTKLYCHPVYLSISCTTSGPASTAGQCPKPCTVFEYHASILDSKLSDNISYIAISYSTTDVMIQSEYYVYTFSGIIGAVGGSLGMFLGDEFDQI